MIEILTFIVAVLSVIVIPLLIFFFRQNSEMVTLKVEVKALKDFEKEFKIEYKKDINIIFAKLDDIKSEIHSKAENYVHKNSCTSCKK